MFTVESLVKFWKIVHDLKIRESYPEAFLAMVAEDYRDFISKLPNPNPTRYAVLVRYLLENKELFKKYGLEEDILEAMVADIRRAGAQHLALIENYQRREESKEESLTFKINAFISFLKEEELKKIDKEEVKEIRTGMRSGKGEASFLELLERRGHAYLASDDNNNAIACFKMALNEFNKLKLSDEKNQQRGLSFLHRNLGLAYSRLPDHALALQNLLRAEKLADQLSPKDLEFTPHYLIWLQQNLFDACLTSKIQNISPAINNALFKQMLVALGKAVRYYLELPIKNEALLRHLVARYYTMYTNFYDHQPLLLRKLLLDAQDACAFITNPNDGDLVYIIKINDLLCKNVTNDNVLSATEKFELQEKALLAMLAAKRQLHDNPEEEPKGLMKDYRCLGELYCRVGKLEQAEQFFDQAKKNCQKKSSLESELIKVYKAYSELADQFIKQGDSAFQQGSLDAAQVSYQKACELRLKYSSLRENESTDLNLAVKQKNIFVLKKDSGNTIRVCLHGLECIRTGAENLTDDNRRSIAQLYRALAWAYQIENNPYKVYQAKRNELDMVKQIFRKTPEDIENIAELCFELANYSIKIGNYIQAVKLFENSIRFYEKLMIYKPLAIENQQKIIAACCVICDFFMQQKDTSSLRKLAIYKLKLEVYSKENRASLDDEVLDRVCIVLSKLSKLPQLAEYKAENSEELWTTGTTLQFWVTEKLVHERRRDTNYRRLAVTPEEKGVDMQVSSMCVLN